MKRTARNDQGRAIALAQKRAAQDGQPRFVGANYNGYTIDRQPAPFNRTCLKITVDSVETVGCN